MRKASLPYFLIHILFIFLALLATDIPAFAQRFEGATALTVGTRAQNVFIGDFNKDGKPDLLVIDSLGGTAIATLQVSLGNGDGTFQSPPISTPSVTDFTAVAVGDFNGDGVTDVAIASFAGTLTIFLGNGDGTFTATAQGPLTTGNNATIIKAVDLNGDGILDLLVANLGDNTLNVFTGKGDGTFTLTDTQSFFSGPPGNLLRLAVGDFDGDGNPDVVVTIDSPASFNILKGNGDGTLQPPVTIPLNMAFASSGLIAAVDFDGDGKLDLVFVGAGVQLFSGNGNLTFQPPVTLSGESVVFDLKIADMNGDGHPDVVLMESGGTKVLLNDGHGRIASSQIYTALPSATLAVGDLNGDGHPDFVVAGTGLVSIAGPNNVQIILNHGDGTMRAGFSVGSSGQGAVIADFNNDGKPDIGISESRSMGAFLNSGNFQFIAPLFSGANVGTSGDMVVADLNGDGNQDLVGVGSSLRGFISGEMVVQLGNGNGTFKLASVQPAALPAPAALHRIAAGDFNGDGKLDVVVTNMDSGTPPTTVGVFLGNGDGTFQAPSIITAGSMLTGIVVGNFDGHLDIAVANKGDGTNPSTVSMLLGNGDGTFTLGTPVTVGVAPVAVAAGDLNGDGKLDLVVANGGSGNGGTVSILLGNGDGTFQSPVTLSLASAAVALTLGDFNGDGFPDIAVAEHGSMIDLFTNNGDGTFPQVPERYATGGDPDFLIAVDLNNGGLPDLLTSGNLNILPNRGGTRIALTSSQNPAGAGSPITFSATVLANVPGTTQPTGTVQFFDGNSSLGNITLSATGTATVTTSTLALGNHTIKASYSGDANHPARNFPDLLQAVRGETSVQVTSSANPSVFGSPVTIGVSVTSTTTGTPTGNVSLLDGTTVIASATLNGSGQASFTLSSLTGGTHNLTASYAGDQNFLAVVSNAALAQVVNRASSSPSLNSSANPSTFSSPVTFAVQVAGVNSIAPTGTVSLLDGVTTVASTTLDNSGNATFNLSNLGAGTHNFTVSYAGDQNFSASVSSNLQQVVNRAGTSSSISSNFNPVIYSSGFDISVTITGPNGVVPTGTVSLMDGAATLTSGTLDASGNVTFAIAGLNQPGQGLGAGTHNFTASYAGDQNFTASVSPILPQVVTKAQSFVSMGLTPNPVIGAQSVSVIVGVSPSTGGVPGTLSLLDGSTVIASGNADASGFFIFNLSTLALGPHSISASYPGDANRDPATTPATSLNVFPLDFSISASTTSSTVNAGQSAMATLTIFSNPSFTTALTFNCSGLPALASCSFSPPTISPNATFQSSTLTITTTGPAATLSSPARGSGHAPLYALVLPGLAGLLLLATRRRTAKQTTLSCLLLLWLALLSSCGGGGGGSMGPNPITQTPDGTSTVVVTANGGVTHQITLTLTVKN